MKKNEKLDRFYFMLVSSLNLLACSFEIQKNAFPPHVNIPDEIALTFHDSFLLCDQLLEAKYIDEEVLAKLKSLDIYISSYENNSEFWTLEAMKNNEKWEGLRASAENILSELKLPVEKPKLDWLEFIKSKDET